MATLNELVFIILNDLNGGVGVTNERFTEEQIEAEIHLMRARLVAELVKTGAKPEAGLYTQFNGIELTLKDFSGTERLSTAKKVKWARIPRLLSVSGNPMVEYVMSPDGSVRLRVRYGKQDRYWMHEAFTGKNPTVLVEDQDMWFFNYQPNYFSYRAIVNNPVDLEDKSYKAEFDRDGQYPMPDYLADILTGKILEGKIRNAVRIRPDLVNTQTDKN